MIRNFQLRPTGVLPSTELLDLGQINIICGRNNSGKSTALRAIENASSRFIGGRIESSDADEICKAYCRGTIYLNDNLYTDLGAEIARVFNAAALSRGCWFAKSHEFPSEVAARIQRHPQLGRYQFDSTKLAQLVDAHLAPSEPRTILIPPRRGLEESAGINFRAKVSSDGQGLLNRLFYCKSQSKGTAERVSEEQVFEAFKEISNGFAYEIIPEQDNTVHLTFKTPSNVSAPARECGQGLQDLMIQLLFTVSQDYDLLLIE